MARMTAKQFFFLKGFAAKVQYGDMAYDFDKAYANGLDLGVAKGIISRIKTNTAESTTEALTAMAKYCPPWSWETDKQNAWLKAHNSTPVETPDETPDEPVPLPGPDDDVAKVVTELINAVSKGKKTIATLNSTIENLSSNILSQNNQIDALNAKVEELTKAPSMPNYTPNNVEYIKPSIYDRARWYIEQGEQYQLIGPAGTGKSRMIREIANDLELEYMAVSLGGGQRYSQVIGSTVLEDNRSRFEPARWLQLAVKGNCVIALEEMTSIDPEVGKGLNQVFEMGSRDLELPCGKLTISPSTRFVAISNTTGRELSAQYTGDQRLDDSMLDRFPIALTMEYSDKTEKTIASKMGLTADNTKELQGMVKTLRDNVRKSQIMFDPSTRRFIRAVALSLKGLTVKESFEAVFLGTLSASERSKAGF